MVCRINSYKQLFSVREVNLPNGIADLGLDNYVKPFYDGLKEICHSEHICNCVGIHVLQLPIFYKFRRIAMRFQITERNFKLQNKS